MNIGRRGTLAIQSAGIEKIGTVQTNPSRCRLCLVTEHEMDNLRRSLERGVLPPDFEAKLAKLASGDLMQQFLAQHCRNFIALLQATHEPAFPALSPVTLDRFLRVLAYVRKDDDAIPDYTPSGYTDDRDEVRATVELLARELEEFKAWRLQHQVPGMWMSKPGAVVVVTPNLN